MYQDEEVPSGSVSDQSASDSQPQAAAEPLNDWQVQILQLKDELDRTKEDSKKHQDQYLRALADFDNLRRRNIKEREDLHKYGVESLLKDLLPVLDSFDTALKWDQGSSEQSASGNDNLFAGIHLVKKQLLDILQKHGLTKIASKGQPFDPNFHQAVAKVASEGSDQEIVHEEFASGYMLHDRLLRPAMVSVK